MGVYMSIPRAAEYLDCSEKTVHRRIREMKESGNFPRDTFLENPKRVKLKDLINFCMEVKT